MARLLKDERHTNPFPLNLPARLGRETEATKYVLG